MNISYNWLKEYVSFNLTAHEVAEALTSIGLEVGSVEEVQTIKGGLKGVVIGEILTCESHPNSDHMHITKVNIGAEEPIQVVCGAANVAQGQKVVVATIGTELYNGDKVFTIKKSKLRGVESYGMICAEDEIGLGKSHDGIMVLPADATPGLPAADYFNIKSDYLIEVDITPNRADACSHYGVARDFYAWLLQNGYQTSLQRPSSELFKVDNNDLPIDVIIENNEACQRYCAVTIKNCTVKDSPEWLQERLRTIGLRPINNIVDITNYILFAYGQPLHCFDADKVKGNKVIIKTLPEGTSFITLDGVEHKLNERDLAICNAEEAMCIAGVFGGQGSGTYDTTTNVLLESAYFNPSWIRKSARRHGLNTDASFRFERGIDPNGVRYALEQAAILCKELAGGEIAMEIKDLYPNPITDFNITLPYAQINALIGKIIPKETIKSIVTSLEMKIISETNETLQLAIPPYRVDVQRPCDVIEDILRIYGYNNVEIPTTIKSSLTVKGDADKSHKLQNLIGEQLVGAGFNEILNNSLTRAAYYDLSKNYPSDKLVRLMNPLSNDLNAMRQSLIFGGLESIAYNANRRNADLKLFEFGNTYASTKEKTAPDPTPCTSPNTGSNLSKDLLSAYTEEYHLGLWLTGKRISNSWAHPDESSTIYEMKAYVLNIFTRLGVNFSSIRFVDGKSDLFSKSIEIQTREGKTLAAFGIVSTAIQKRFEINNEVYYADINWTRMMKAIRKNSIRYTEICKYPPVSRDLALLVEKDVEFAQIEAIAYNTEKKLLKEVKLFDVYEGKKLEAGKKSYAVNFTLQDEQKTLNDKQIDAIMQKIITNLTTQLHAQLR